MATTTTILELTKPEQGATNWHVPINANWDTIDSKLGQGYKNFWNEGDVTYITNNAKYVTDHWERWDTSKAASMIKLNIDGSYEIYNAVAGTGTISWVNIYEMDETGEATFTTIGNLKYIASDVVIKTYDSYSYNGVLTTLTKNHYSPTSITESTINFKVSVTNSAIDDISYSIYVDDILIQTYAIPTGTLNINKELSIDSGSVIKTTVSAENISVGETTICANNLYNWV